MLSASLTGAAGSLGIAPVAPHLVALTTGELQSGLAVAAAAAGAMGLLALLGRASSSTPPASSASAPSLGRRLLNLASDVAVGATFSLGLGLCGMTRPTKVVGFLTPLLPSWDWSLPFVMGSAMAVAMVGYQAVLRGMGPPRPLLAEKFSIPTSTVVDPRLIIGGLLFGCGWGMSGICPGPGIVAAVGSFSTQVGCTNEPAAGTNSLLLL